MEVKGGKHRNNHSIAFLVIGVLGLIGLGGVVGYQLGLSNGEDIGIDRGVAQEKERAAKDTKTKDELLSGRLSEKINVDISALKAKLNDLSVASKKTNADISGLNIESTAARIEDTKARIEGLPKQIETQVILPPNSPSAKVLAAGKTPGGVSTPVARSFEQETGIPSTEIDSLMNQR